MIEFRTSVKDEAYMQMALEEAKKAMNTGDVPIGAVITHKGEVIGKAGNKTRLYQDPTAHAEILAIREAAAKLNNWRLQDCDIYVTIEPCSMCAGAIVLARLNRLVIGAMDEKAGACGSVLDITNEKRLNHQPEVTTGILEEECRKLIQEFFKQIRNK